MNKMSDGKFWSGSKLLDKKHLQNCKVIPHRFYILDLLPKNSICAELGVSIGDFSKEILTRSDPKQLYLIESKSELVDKLSYRFRENEEILVECGYSWDVLNNFKDDFFDWVYIDSDHSYDSTKLELEISHKKVKEGGYILLHDYIWIDYISEKYKSYGVIKAVNEFCVNFNYEFIYISMEPNMYHTVCLRKLI